MSHVFDLLAKGILRYLSEFFSEIDMYLRIDKGSGVALRCTSILFMIIMSFVLGKNDMDMYVYQLSDDINFTKMH